MRGGDGGWCAPGAHFCPSFLFSVNAVVIIQFLDFLDKPAVVGIVSLVVEHCLLELLAHCLFELLAHGLFENVPFSVFVKSQFPNKSRKLDLEGGKVAFSLLEVVELATGSDGGIGVTNGFFEENKEGGDVSNVEIMGELVKMGHSKVQGPSF